jgi:nucleotide-binding universal stress UspA family protein
MKTILVATDFSTRSDRALRRATLLAKQHGAKLKIVHVVDDDRSQRLVASEQADARILLDELSTTIASVDGVECQAKLYLGLPYDGVIHAADELEADLIVMGPHRSETLKDMFVGTTVDRVIRRSRRPVLMANGVPTGSYSSVLIGTDMSPGSAKAVAAATALGLLRGAQVGVVHAFSAPSYRLMLRASVTSSELKDYIKGERAEAGRELKTWLRQVGLKPDFEMLELPELSTANLINECARLKKAELIVIGTKGRSGLERVFLGSVAEDVLRWARVDVLTVA